MRVLLTALLIAVFVPAFVAFWLVRSVVGYAADTDAVVDSARAADLRGLGIQILVDDVYEELDTDPVFKPIPREQLRAIAEDIVTQRWFDDALRTAHAAFVRAILDARDDAVIDLRDTRRQLTESLDGLRERALDECAAVLGPALCSGDEAAEQVVGAYDAKARAAVADIPDEIDLVDELGVKDVEQIRSRLGDTRTVQWVGLGVLLVCLLAIMALNAGAFSRLLWATGLALALAAAAYLIVVAGARASGEEAVRDEMLARLGPDDAAPADELALALSLQVARDATGYAHGPVLVIGGLGVIALVGAAITGGARRRA